MIDDAINIYINRDDALNRLKNKLKWNRIK